MNKNMRITTCCVIMLVLLCTLLPAGAEETSVPVTGGTWFAANGSQLTFSADGTGTFINENEKRFDITWTIQNQQIVFEYNFYRIRTVTLSVSDDGTKLVNISDATEFSRDAAANDAAAIGYELKKGEEIDLGFLKMTLTEIMLLDSVKPSNAGMLLDPKEGYKYLCLAGPVSNTASEELNFKNIKGTFSVGRYQLKAEVRVLTGELTGYTMQPLTTGVVYFACELPAATANEFVEASLLLGMNDNLKSQVQNVENADFVFRLPINESLIKEAKVNAVTRFKALRALLRTREYFKESPALIKPTAFADVKETFFNDNHKDYVTYKFTCTADDVSQEDTFIAYRKALQAEGYGIREKNETFEVYVGKRKLAKVATNTFNWIEVDLFKGNSNFTERPSASNQTTQEDMMDPTDPVVKIGGTIKLTDATLKVSSAGNADKLYSCIKTNTAKRWRYYYADKGETLAFLYCTIKNTGSAPLDVRNIYAELILDGDKHYKLDSAGVKNGKQDFITTLNPGSEIGLYIFGGVDKKVWDKYKSCEFRLGFTDGFQYIHINQSNLPDFDKCDQTFMVKVK